MEKKQWIDEIRILNGKTLHIFFNLCKEYIKDFIMSFVSSSDRKCNSIGDNLFLAFFSYVKINHVISYFWVSRMIDYMVGFFKRK